MNETSDRSHFTPQGWRIVTPRIVVHEAQLLVEFLKYVFMGDRRVSIRRTNRPEHRRFHHHD